MKILSRLAEVFQETNDGENVAVRQMIGPAFLIVALALAGKSAPLIAAGVIGLYFAARSQTLYALITVACLALVQQIIGTDRPVWFLGLEVSIGCSLLITSLSFQSGLQFVQSLISQKEAQSSSLQNLEEELSKQIQSALTQQIALQNKLQETQKELVDIQEEQSSLFVLNEVLRKTAVRHTEEKEALEEKSLNQQRRIAMLQADLLNVEKELERLSHPESLAQQNRQLFQELNAARYQREQTQLINETLVRLHAKESLKAKEAEGLKTMLDQALQEKEALRSSLGTLEDVQTEKRFLQDRLTKAQNEMDHLKAQLAQETARIQAVVQEKEAEIQQAKARADSGPLLLQLRQQFEEKNKVLHETRSALFRVETELQALRLEKEELLLQVDSIPPAVQEDLSRLEEENLELEELVSLLTLKKK